MNTLIGSPIGLVHLIAGVVALVLGLAVLLMHKGTRIHRRVGYAYVLSMGVLIVSSFAIYRLFGRFGVFHVLSLVSMFTLVGGLLPMLRKQRKDYHYEMHISFMYFSVVGLYAAFAAESFSRVSRFGNFWQAVAWGSVLIFVTCFMLFIRMKPIWSARFGRRRVLASPASVSEHSS